MRKRDKQIGCYQNGCDARIRVEVTAPNRQVGKRLHAALRERLDAEGWEIKWFPYTRAYCNQHKDRPQ